MCRKNEYSKWHSIGSEESRGRCHRQPKYREQMAVVRGEECLPEGDTTRKKVCGRIELVDIVIGERAAQGWEVHQERDRRQSKQECNCGSSLHLPGASRRRPGGSTRIISVRRGILHRNLA